MKILLFILLLTISALYSQQNIAPHKLKPFYIEKDTIKKSYIIYSSDGKLFYVLSKINSDNVSLETLKMIYDSDTENFSVSDSFRKALILQSAKDSTDGFNWNEFFQILLATFLGSGATVFIAWFIYNQQKKDKEKADNKERFENLFLNLLNYQNEIINNISMEVVERGREFKFSNISFFRYIKIKMKLFYNNQLATYGKVDHIKSIIYEKEYQYYFADNYFLESSFNTFNQESPMRNPYNDVMDMMKDSSAYTYQKIYDVCYDYLGHYFRNLYNIIKFLENKENEIKTFGGDINSYVGMIQARMSFSELFILFYNGLLFEKMGKYIDKYHLIENLPYEDLMDEKHKDFYICKMKSKMYYHPIKPEQEDI
jgi:hypothetical protein